ncbi:hypothetical protein BKA69DRAFT_662417 [Paraphysoderma sedebokerense]|nr:hypothetical protein BKA69DRAFT_662417 [Paraphysoderma sedebokerense]
MEMLFLGAYVRSEATSYLTETLAKPVRDLLPTLDKCEIDPFRAPPEDLAANEERLQKAAMTILSAIIQSHRKIPKTIRRLCRFLRKEIEATLFDAFNAGNVLNRTISDSQSSLVSPPEEPQNTSPVHGGGGGLTRRRSTRSSFARTIERRNSEDADTMLSPITEKTMYATASQILSEPVPDPSADATNSANVEPSNQTHQPEEPALQLDSFTLHAIINQMDADITDQPHQQMNTCSSVETPHGDKLPENNPTTSPDSPSKRSVSSAESYYSSPTRSTFSRRSMGGLSEDRSVRSIHSDDESGGSPSKMKRTNVSLRRNRNIVKKQVKGKTIVYSIADQVLASFLFLRFYVPALMQPELYHLLEASEVTPPIFRGLVLCGKVLVSLCNDVDTKTKEMHLLPSIQFLQEQRQRVKFFLGVITKDEVCLV